MTVWSKHLLVKRGEMEGRSLPSYLLGYTIWKDQVRLPMLPKLVNHETPFPL
jgi:hypothetical protein